MKRRIAYHLSPLAVLAALVGGLLELASLQSWRLRDRLGSRR